MNNHFPILVKTARQLLRFLRNFTVTCTSNFNRYQQKKTTIKLIVRKTGKTFMYSKRR